MKKQYDFSNGKRGAVVSLPKEPKTFKYPRVYWRENWHQDKLHETRELVIIFPKKKMESIGTSLSDHKFLASYEEEYNEGTGFHICWDSRHLTPKQKVKRLKKYAKDRGVKTYFLGEIK